MKQSKLTVSAHASVYVKPGVVELVVAPGDWEAVQIWLESCPARLRRVILHPSITELTEDGE